jgi:hypothetical protein
MTTVAPWDKRLRAPTLRSISQNQSLGARYFRFEALSSSYGRPANNPLTNAVDVLEELANHGRCIVVLPDESRLGLYAVEAETGQLRLIWYEPPRLLPPADDLHRWEVTLEVAPLELDDPSHDMAFARRSRVKESIDD